MEWVEIRGETVAAAEELALDQLGVARADAEFEVVQAPESKWMGLKKTEARVRARVRPTAPPPKQERKPRQRKGRNDRGGEKRSSNNRSNDGGRPNGDGGRSGGGKSGRSGGGEGQRKQGNGGQRQGNRGGGGQKQRNDAPAKAAAPKNDGASASPKAAASPAPKQKEKRVSDDAYGEPMPVEEQTETVTEFLQGLIDGFGVDATASAALEDDVIVGAINGEDIGLLVGPRAGTLRAIQELARTSAQRQAAGRDSNRLMIDVGGYRERRRKALAEFATKQADVVLDSGEALALEPMDSADRKVVHDTIGEIDGVTTSSAGEDNRRHVVISPEG